MGVGCVKRWRRMQPERKVVIEALRACAPRKGAHLNSYGFMDTQWPRFQVFVQEREGDPYLDYGSVHAPDAELALYYGRNVFARRPEAIGMWVVPAQAIYARTAEELSCGIAPEAANRASGEAREESYHVFCKPRPAGMLTQVGMVEAVRPEQALQRALQTFLKRYPPTRPPAVWWVFPAAQALASRPEDIASLYAPAREKTFRLSTDFRTHSAMRSIKGKLPEKGGELG